MRLILAAVSATAMLSASAAPALAHHSAAMFDPTKELALSGTVKAFQYTNPHAWLIVSVPDNGKTTDWSVELGAPTMIQRMGILPSTFPTGEKVTVRLHPMKDGRNGGEFLSVQKADGSLVGRRPGAPAPGSPPPGAPPSGA